MAAAAREKLFVLLYSFLTDLKKSSFSALFQIIVEEGDEQHFNLKSNK